MQQESFQKFIGEQAYWLEGYAQFMAIKAVHYGNKEKETWYDWDEVFKNRQLFLENMAEFDKIAMNNKEQVDCGQWNTDEFPEWTSASLSLYQQISSHIQFHGFLQWVAWEQWNKLKKFANAKEILIIGDCPIYVAPDSADVWSNREVFKLDEDGNQLSYAGVPPDYFSPKYGQFWGNPIYNWYLDADNRQINKATFDWWTLRLRHQLSLFDELRVDHFRGFAGYWEIPANQSETMDDDGKVIKSAKNGSWKHGPGAELFKYIADHTNRSMQDLPIIAEDLGVITDEVTQLRKALAAPGMGILQFAPWKDLFYQTDDGQFIKPETLDHLRSIHLEQEQTWYRLFYGGENLTPFTKHEFLPHNAEHLDKLVFYPGTHDNSTLLGWFYDPDRTPLEQEFFASYLNCELKGQHLDEHLNWKVIWVLCRSPQVRYAIFQMQDILGLLDTTSDEYSVTRYQKGEPIKEKIHIEANTRTNIPNAEGGQWQWKLGGNQQFTPAICQKLRYVMEQTGRLNIH